MALEPKPEPARAPRPAAQPRVEEGTALAMDEALRARWQRQLDAARVDPAVWRGAFATNVWGGRYEMDGLLGHGGQGATFVGTDRKTGARVAVKVLDLKHAADWKRVELFEREARTLRQVEHEGMPAFVDLLEDPGTGARALVMTLVQGEDFGAVLARDGPLSEAALWRVLLDVTDVLRTLHGQSSPVVHRDIKPKNLVRRPDGRICVVDFGGVGKKSEGGSTVVGTFGYMAPEQLYGRSAPATDLYALGATLLTLATGKEPEELAHKGLSLDVDKAGPGLSEPLRIMLKRMLAPDPEDRPADGAALAQELHALAVGQQVTDKAKEAVGVDAELDERPRNDLAEAVDVLTAFLKVLVGVLGTVAVVLIGEILLPILFSLIAAFSTGPSKERVERAKGAVKVASQVVKDGFSKVAKEGAQGFQQRSDLDRQRRRRR
jgi:hypothetical protein